MLDLPALGLLSWIAAGLAVAAVARRWPAPAHRAWWPGALLAAGLGAVLGGLLATWLDFGGVAVFDWRSSVIAALAGLVAVWLVRAVTLWRRG